VGRAAGSRVKWAGHSHSTSSRHAFLIFSSRTSW
jgi:hypothetical protein